MNTNLKIEKLLKAGRIAHKRGATQEADLCYTAALKSDPDHPDANHNMGILLRDTNKLNKAIPFLRKALKGNPNEIRFCFSYLDTLIQSNNISDAKDFLSKARKTWVGDNRFEVFEKMLNQKIHNSHKVIVFDPPKDRLQDLLNLYNDGKTQQARDETCSLLEQFPKSTILYNIKGAANAMLGFNDDAIRSYKTALSINSNYVEARYNMAILFRGQGKLDEAAEAFKKVIDQKPDFADAYNNLGLTLQNQGRLDEAIEVFNKAISVKHDYAEAYNNSGITFQFQRKLGQAVESYKKALEIDPNYSAAHNNVGSVFQEQGKLNKAMAAFEKALEIDPNYSAAHNNIGLLLQVQGQFEEAVTSFKTATSLNPNYAEAFNNLGIALQNQGNLDEAIKAFQMALEINNESAQVYNNMGNALFDQGKLDEAISTFKNATTLKQDYAEAFHNMGNVFKAQAKLEDARKAYKKAIHVNPYYSSAHLSLSSIICYKDVQDPHIKQVRVLYKDKKLTEDKKSMLSFALSKMYEDLGEIQKSFKFLAEGNSRRKKFLGYNFYEDERLFEKLKKTQPKISKNSFALKNCRNKILPIFILGMPRSGTTLVEQIISSHPKVTGAGELDYISQFGMKLVTGHTTLDKASISEFRENYSSALIKLSNGKIFVTDKMPQNFRFIPLICAALPEAKIIHVHRNPAATCWSNYKQYFASKELGYCYDQEDVVNYYMLYRNLMNIWEKLYGDKIYNLDYEKLTTDQDNETRKVINYLKLDWDNSCLFPQKNKRSVRTASQQQVREKVYQGSSEAWRRYKPFFNRIFTNLPSY